MTTPTSPLLPEPATAAMKVTAMPHPWIWDFLDGSAGYMGVHYGERHPDHPGLFWWRPFLRQEVEAMRKNRSDAEAALNALRAEVEQYRQLFNASKLGHEQAFARCQELSADAERYQLLRRGQRWSVIDGIGNTLRADELDASIDAMKGDAHAR